MKFLKQADYTGHVITKLSKYVKSASRLGHTAPVIEDFIKLMKD